MFLIVQMRADYRQYTLRVALACSCLFFGYVIIGLSSIILEKFKVDWVRLRLTKPEALTKASGVGVLIERGR